jgi:zinc transporter ZupT
MEGLIYLLALATFLFTLAGGFLALKLKKCLPYMFAFAAGSIIAVAFLDILPESLELAEGLGISVRTIMIIAVASFFLYSLLEKVFVTHHMEDDKPGKNHRNHSGHSHAHILGPIGAGSLIVHSFLDGAAIGLAFQVDVAAGLIVALAVILHDMTDGINTVVLMLKNKQPVRRAVKFLIADAIAPSIGLLITSFIVIPETWLVYILSFFVGEFLYIGASTLVPETRDHPSRKTIIAMALGILLIIILTSFLG